MDYVKYKSCYGVILLYSLMGVSFNFVLRPRDLTLGTENRNWMNADKACQTDGLQLLSYITKDNMVDIRTLMNLWKVDGILTSSVWVGLTRHNDELGFKWDSCSDVIPREELPWALGHPVSNPVETCVIIDEHSFQLKMTSCINQYQYICEKPRDVCWFDAFFMQETIASKMEVGTLNKDDCEDRCREFNIGIQECVLIEIKGNKCYIVISDRQYIDDTPTFMPATSSYPIVEVKRCLGRSHRQSLMVHIRYFSLPPREPCPTSSPSVLSSSDLHHLINSSPVSESVSVSLIEVSSYTETNSPHDSVIYPSTTEINGLSSTAITVLSTDEFYQTETVTSNTHFGNLNTDNQLTVQTSDLITVSSDTTTTDYSTYSIENSLQASENELDTWTTSISYSSSSIITASSLLPSSPASTVLDLDTALPSVTSSTPYQSIYSVTNPKFNSLCRCVCLKNDFNVTGLTQTKLAEIRKKLYVDTSTLSSTRRKLTSAEDHRPSAIITGQLGLVVLILVFCFFLVLDAQRFIFAIYEFMKRKITKTVIQS